MRLPWAIWPFSWGLKGKERARSRAHYYLEGEALDLALAEIDHEGRDLELAKLSIRLKYHRMSVQDYDYKVAEIMFQDDADELNWNILKFDLKYNKITKNEYLKQFNTLKDRPYIAITSDYDYKMGASGLTIDWDWNPQFVDMLMQEGYDGYTDTDVIETWWIDICRSQMGLPLVGEEPGEEEISEDPHIETNHVKRRRTRRVRSEDGPLSFS
jgi:hypothetical protein